MVRSQLHNMFKGFLLFSSVCCHYLLVLVISINPYSTSDLFRPSHPSYANIPMTVPVLILQQLSLNVFFSLTQLGGDLGGSPAVSRFVFAGFHCSVNNTAYRLMCCVVAHRWELVLVLLQL